MWSIGFTRVAGATTWTGDVTDAPAAGLEKQTEPAAVEPGLGGGTGAGAGNGATPVNGPWAICTVTDGHVGGGAVVVVVDVEVVEVEVDVDVDVEVDDVVDDVVDGGVAVVFGMPPQPARLSRSKLTATAARARMEIVDAQKFGGCMKPRRENREGCVVAQKDAATSALVGLLG